MENLLLETQLVYLQTLHTIVCESDEPETVRSALAALTNTEAGLDYLRMNPIRI